jgi:prepilin-type N-terminal cleavage/methylation domain-containing protein
MRKPAAALTGQPIIAAAAPRQRGFSLLELLVALMVVVLVTTLVNLSVSSGGEDIQLQSQVLNLADVASYALDEAQMTGVDYGLLLQEEEQQGGEMVYSYSWLQRQVDGWAEPDTSGEMFAPQQLPPGVALELELEETPVVELSLDETDYEEDDEDRVLPQVVFYSSGETTVGAINVRKVDDGELLWRIEWDLLGRFKPLRRGLADEEDL